MSVSPLESSTESADDFGNSTFDVTIRIIYWKSWEYNNYICLVTVLFGALSFVLIPQWRNFRNFAFTNVFLAEEMHIFSSGYYYVDWVNGDIGMILYDTSLFSMPLWQVWAAYSFYMHIVKIFSVQSSRLYLYATISAWIVPATAAVGVYVDYCLQQHEHRVGNETHINKTDNAEDEEDYYYGVDWKYMEYVQITASITNLLLYLRVLYVLLFPTKIRSSNPSASYPRIRIATFIFLISGAMTYMPILIGDRIKMKSTLAHLPYIIYTLQLVLIKVLFLVLKSHRTLWMEAIKRWCRRRDSADSTFTTIIYFTRRRQN